MHVLSRLLGYDLTANMHTSLSVCLAGAEAPKIKYEPPENTEPPPEVAVSSEMAEVEKS